jgi:hypothetical protein
MVENMTMKTFALLATAEGSATVTMMSLAGRVSPEWVEVPPETLPGDRIEGASVEIRDVIGPQGDVIGSAAHLVGGAWVDMAPERAAAIAAQPLEVLIISRVQLVRQLRTMGLAARFKGLLSELPEDIREDWSLANELASDDPLCGAMATALEVEIRDVFTEAGKL